MRYGSLFGFLALAAAWGTAFMAIESGLTDFPPVLFAAFRFDIASLVMLGYATLVADPLPRDRRSWAAVGVSALLLIAAYHAFLFVGETEEAVTPAAAAVIVSLSPILTTVFARGLLPDERLTPIGIAGLLLGLVGVVVLAEPAPDSLLGADGVGKGLVFLAAASFALGSVITRRLDPELPDETLEAWAMVFGAGLLHLIAAVRPGEGLDAVNWTVEGIAALLYLAIVASGIGFLLYFRLLDRLGPIEINLVSYVAPVFAAISGWFFLAEPVSPATAVGFILILAGFGLVKRQAIREELPRLRRALNR